MFRSSLFVPACCSQWLNVQLTRMTSGEIGIHGIGVEVDVHVEVDIFGKIRRRRVLTGGRRVLTGGRRIQRGAQ